MKTVYYSALVWSIAVSSALAFAQEATTKIDDAFTSRPAKDAMSKFTEAVEILTKKNQDEMLEIKNVLRQDLLECLKEAVNSNDLDEVRRITAFLQQEDAPIEVSKPEADVSLEEIRAVQSRMEGLIRAAKQQAVANFESIARTAAAQGKLDRAIDAWKEVIFLDPTHKEAKSFFGLLKNKKVPIDVTDRRNVWQKQDDPNFGFIKTNTGWKMFGNDKPLQEIGRTKDTIVLQMGADFYHIHGDAVYGRSATVAKWHFHGHGEWVR